MTPHLTPGREACRSFRLSNRGQHPARPQRRTCEANISRFTFASMRLSTLLLIAANPCPLEARDLQALRHRRSAQGHQHTKAKAGEAGELHGGARGEGCLSIRHATAEPGKLAWVNVPLPTARLSSQNQAQGGGCFWRPNTQLENSAFKTEVIVGMCLFNKGVPGITRTGIGGTQQYCLPKT
jgi:hypothetical protein